MNAVENREDQASTLSLAEKRECLDFMYRNMEMVMEKAEGCYVGAARAYLDVASEYSDTLELKELIRDIKGVLWSYMVDMDHLHRALSSVIGLFEDKLNTRLFARATLAILVETAPAKDQDQ